MTEAGVVVWYNPRCSKCRGAGELLAAHGVPARRVLYLDDPPPPAEIARVLALLGATDPRALMRTAEPRYRELGLADASAAELIDAMSQYPELIERPVVIWPDRAVATRLARSGARQSGAGRAGTGKDTLCGILRARSRWSPARPAASAWR